MRSDHYQNDSSEQTFIVVVMAMVIFMLMAVYFYNSHKRSINRMAAAYIGAQLALVAPFSEQAGRIKMNLANTDPEKLSMKDMWTMTSYAGRRLRWLVLPLCVGLAWLVYFPMGRVERLRRKFTMKMLLENNVKIFPEIAPALNRPRPINEEPMDSGPWRTARTALQFAVENGLIVDQDKRPVPAHKMIGSDGLPLQDATALRLENGLFLDMPRAEHAFVSQLGDVFEGPEKLKPHHKALAAGLLAYANSDRAAGIGMLNQLSMSFREPPESEYSKRDLKYHQKLIVAALLVYVHSDKTTGITALSQTFLLLSQPALNKSVARRISRRMAIMAALLLCINSDREGGTRMLCQLLPLLNAPLLSESKDSFVIDTSGADELLRKYSTEHKELIQHASYTNCWLSALLEFARGKGVIACSMFVWLRPIDRTLWYSLNQCGRRVAWPEAAGVRAHMQVEAERAHAISIPQVEGAVQAMEQSLIEEGYIFMAGIMEEEIEGRQCEIQAA